MGRYQVILAYDGTRYKGYQRQARYSGIPEPNTVQRVIEDALYRLGWHGKRLQVAGRTDSGVHASGQVIAFDLEWKHAPQDLLRALNANLPTDVAARAVKTVPQNFNPRYAAVSRFYRYRLFCDEVRSPLRERYAWRVWPSLDSSLIRQAVQELPGSHNFAAFGTPSHPGGSTVRHVERVSWMDHDLDYAFEIVGDGFLYHMVRRLVFFLVAIGQGKISPDKIAQLLLGQESVSITGVAPAHGLTLVEVTF
jgi:tRNA pseudouridine38-40 synthase